MSTQSFGQGGSGSNTVPLSNVQTMPACFERELHSSRLICHLLILCECEKHTQAISTTWLILLGLTTATVISGNNCCIWIQILQLVTKLLSTETELLSILDEGEKDVSAGIILWHGLGIDLLDDKLLFEITKVSIYHERTDDVHQKWKSNGLISSTFHAHPSQTLIPFKTQKFVCNIP